MTIDMTDPEVKEAIEAAAETAAASKVAGLVAKRDELLAETKAAKAALDAYSGLDIEKYKALEEKEAADALVEEERRGEYEKMRERLNTAHSETLAERDKNISRLTASLESNMIESQLATALASAKGVPELLVPTLKQHLRVAQNGDGYTTQVVTPTGDIRLSDDGTPMTVKELVTEFKANPTFSRAFGAENSGGGAGGSSAGGGTRDGLMEQLASAAKANNIGEYKKIKEKIAAL